MRKHSDVLLHIRNHMNKEYEKIRRLFRLRNILWPLVIGGVAAVVLIARNFDREALQHINWDSHSLLWILVILVLVVIRQVAYMYRIRLLTDCSLTWRKSFDVISLWEFASAITPTVVGGSAVAVYIVHREGISTGRSTAIVLITAFLDELFFVIMVPFVWLLAPSAGLFDFSAGVASGGLTGVFWTGYTIIVLITLVIGYGVFIHPRSLQSFLVRIFGIRFLRKWKQDAEITGQDIITTSYELKGKPLSFWIRAFFATAITWSARFLVVNVLLLAFLEVSDHLWVFARHLMIWVILLITPTPGGSGVAELIFGGFLGNIVPEGLSHPLAILWRLVTYYPYIILGIIVLPLWLKRVFGKAHSV